MAFTEHYCNASTGSNMNGGDSEGDPTYTATNGALVTATGVFTPTSGDPSAVTPTLVGQMAHIFLDGGTTPVFIGRVTARDSTTVTVSPTAKSGTMPAADPASGVSIRVGGAWKGPNGAVNFPFGFLTSAQTNAAGDLPRVNFKNNAQYDVTAAISHAGTETRFQGYATTIADGGKAVIDAGAGNFAILTVSGANNDLADLTIQNNGTGTSAGLVLSGAEILCRQCVVHSVRNAGFSVTGATVSLVECEAYACNQANTSNIGAFNNATGGDTRFIRCIAHDNTGSNVPGFRASVSATFIQCISDTNGSDGFRASTTTAACTIGCNAYNNGADGIALGNASAAHFYIENCNLIKNAGWGINGTGAGARNGSVLNCGFGAGAQANTSGTTTSLKSMVESGSVTYDADVTPWVDPANGDFSINLAAAIGAGRGVFPGSGGTVGFPDIGAAQSNPDEFGGGGGLTNLTLYS